MRYSISRDGRTKTNYFHILKDLVWNSQKASDFDRHLKKTKRYNSWNAVAIITKMLTLIWIHQGKKDCKYQNIVLLYFLYKAA